MRSPVERLKSMLRRFPINRAIRVPQELIDDAFPTDDQAMAWFKNQGMTLVPVRIYGLPGLATVIRDAVTIDRPGPPRRGSPRLGFSRVTRPWVDKLE